MVWRRGIEPPSLLLASNPISSLASLSFGGASRPGLHSNVAPHQMPTAVNVFKFIAITPMIRVETVIAMETSIAPPNEKAQVIPKVAFTAKSVPLEVPNTELSGPAE